MESVHIFEVFSGLHFPSIGMKADIYSVNLRIQSERGEIRMRKTASKDTFYPVHKQTSVQSQQQIHQECTHHGDFPIKIGGDLFSQILYMLRIWTFGDKSPYRLRLKTFFSFHDVFISQFGWPNQRCIQNSGVFQTFKMKPLTKMFNGWKPLSIFAKRLTLHFSRVLNTSLRTSDENLKYKIFENLITGKFFRENLG